MAVAAKRSVAASAAGPGNEPALAPAVVPGPASSGSVPTPPPPGPASRVVFLAPAGAPEPIAPPSPVAPDVAIDPVCGMEVAAVAASAQCMRDGVRYYFCGSGCQQAFEAGPGASAAR
ncbi:MAG: YHS domain-containing protein [Actinomycetota bacterium]|nr:YHS domain-containing protein [Actinomycetota bacterium]